MDDKLQTLHTNLVKEGYDLPDYNTFKTDMSDPAKSQKLHDNLVAAGYDLPDYATFVGDMGLSKKKLSSQDYLTSASGKEEIPFLGQSGKNPNASVEPSTPPSSSISAEPEKPIDLKTPLSNYIVQNLATPTKVTKGELEERVGEIDKRLQELPTPARQEGDPFYSTDPFIASAIEPKENTEREHLLQERDEITKQLTTPTKGEYIIKKGVENSMIGIGASLLNGEQGLKEHQQELQWLEKYHPSTLVGGVATALGFLLDMPVFSGAGKVGQMATQPLVDMAVNKLAKNLVKKGFSEAVAKKLTLAGAKKATQVLTSGSALGGYGAVAETLNQWSQPNASFDDINVGQILKRGAKDFLLGTAVGSLGLGESYLAGKARAIESGIGRAVAQTGRFAGGLTAESALFAYGGALLEGKSPREVTKDDFVNTLALMGILKVQGAISSLKETTVGLYRSLKYDPVKAGQGEYSVDMQPWEVNELGGKDYNSLMQDLSKDDTKLASILKDDKVPAILKQKLLWGSRGVVLDKTGFRAADIRTFDNDIEIYNENGVLLDKRRYADPNEAQNDAIRIGLRLQDNKAQVALSSSPNKLKILSEFKSKGGDVEQLLLALDKDPTTRTPEESKAVGGFYDLVDKIDTGVVKEKEQAVKNDIERRKAELKVKRDEDLKSAKTPEAKTKVNDDFNAEVNKLDLESKVGNKEAIAESENTKENIEKESPAGNTGVYNKQDVIDAMTDQPYLNEEDKAFMKEKMATDEAYFEKNLKRSAFNRVGKFFVGPERTKNESKLPKEEEIPLKSEKGGLPLEEKAMEGDVYKTPNGNLTWDEVVDKFEPDIKSIDSFYNISEVASKKIGKETIKGKVTVRNTRLGLQKEFPNKSKAQEWINGEGTQIYNDEVNKRKETYKEFKIGGQENAESTGNEITEGSKQPQGLEQGEETGIRVRNASQNGLETGKGEEVTPPKEENLPIQSTEKPLAGEPTEPIPPKAEENPPTIENKPITATQEEKQGEIPPKPPEPPKGAENAPKVPEREKALLNRMHDAEKLSKEFKKGVEDKGLTYEQIPNSATAEEVDYMIADKGLDEAEKSTLNTNNEIEPRVRALSAVRLVKALDDLAGQAETPAEEYAYRERAIKMADFIDKEGRKWGQGIQMFGSAEVNDMLEPKTQVIRMKKEVRRQRDVQLENNKEDIDKKKKDLTQVNKDVAGEVINSKEFEELKKRVVELEKKLSESDKPRTTRQIPADKIAQSKQRIKEQWDIFKQAGKESLSASAIGLNAKQIEALGNIVTEYVKIGVYKAEDLIAKLKKDYLKNVGQELSDEDAKKALPKEIDGKALSEIEAEGMANESSDKLVGRISRMLEDPKVPKDDPIRQMIDTLFEKVKEKDTKEKKPVEKKSALDKIREAVEDKKEYADVWEEAKEKVKQKIESNEELSQAQKDDYAQRLDGFYEEVIGKPFSEKQTTEATKQGLKDIGASIDKVIKEHYTVYDATKRTLQEKLIEDTGLSGEDAKLLSDAVGKQFDKLAVARKKALLKQGITAKEVVKPKQAKQLYDKLIELTNLGAFSDAEFAEAYADKWGFPKLEPEQAKEIERLAKSVQDAPEGYQKFERIQDLLAYTENIKGMDMGDVYMSMWYSSILSGYRTQSKNFVQNTITSLFEGAVSTMQNPLNTIGLWRGLTTGWGEGIRQFGHIMKTGYNPIKGYKTEVPSVQERFSFKGGNANPANWGKYVTRLMVAADAFSYAGLKEMRSFEIALNEARKLNKNATEPTKGTWATATELLNKTSEKVAIAEQQATSEGLRGVEHRRRVWELMEQGRSKEMIEDAAHFAAHGTFNYAPEGVLGMATESISRLTQDVAFGVKVPFSEKKMTVRPVKFIIPFTRIIANVTNMALDYYPPTGLFRAATGSIGARAFEENPRTKGFYHKYTPEERAKVLTKAMIGIAAQVGMYMLTQPDDDGKSAIEVTANGYGDFQKNYELKELGWQPYSIKIGDKWYSYQYTPLILALAPIGYMRDMQTYNKDKAKDENVVAQLGMAYFKGLQVITDMTWASSLNSLMQAFTSKDPAQAQSVMKNLATSTAKGMIYPKLAEQITQVIDAAQSNPRHDAKDLIGKILRDIPIARNKYNIMLNAVGEPVLYDPLQMTANVKHDPFWEWLTDKNINIGKPDQKHPYWIDIDKQERGLTNQEYYDFVRMSGPEIKRRIEEEVIPETLSNADAKKAVEKIKTEVREKTRTEMFAWGDLRQSNEQEWDYLRKNGVLQVPYSSEVLRINNKKVSLTKDQLEEFNNKAINTYIKLIHGYLDRGIGDDQTKIQDPFTGTTVYDYKVKANWEASVARAKAEMTKKIKPR